MSLLSRAAYFFTPGAGQRDALGGANDPNQPLYQALMAAGIDGGAGGVSGLPAISTSTAPRLSAVYRAVSIIANTVGALPLHTYRERPDGTAERISIPSERFIWGTPNPETTRADFWSHTIAHIALSGEAFLHVARGGAGQPVELWPIHPGRVLIGREEPDRYGRRRKIYTLDNNQNDLPLRDYADGGTVIHIPNLRLEGEHGLNPISYMRRTLQMASAAEEYGARIFSNGSLPAGYLSTEADLDQAQVDKLRANWEKFHRGLGNAYRVAVLDNGAKWAPTSIKPEEAQFLDTRHFQVEEIARIFGVPPHLLFESRGSTSWGSGLEEQTTAFVVFTLSNYSTRVEQAISDQLLRVPENHYAKFNYGGLLRGRTIERYQAYQVAISNGIMTPNEVRRLEDLPPRTDAGGDEYIRPLNMAPTSAPPIDPNLAPPAAPAP